MDTLSEPRTLLYHWHVADEHYRNRACADLACALSEQLGLPMYLLRGRYSVGHAIVLDGEQVIDIRGRRPLADVIREWDEQEPDCAPFTLEAVADENRRALAQEWAYVHTFDLRRARRWVRRLLACDLAPPHVLALAATR